MAVGVLNERTRVLPVACVISPPMANPNNHAATRFIFLALTYITTLSASQVPQM